MSADDDDYIPFEGPFRPSRGPKKLSPEEFAKMQELVLKLRLNEPGRMRRPGSGTGQSARSARRP